MRFSTQHSTKYSGLPMVALLGGMVTLGVPSVSVALDHHDEVAEWDGVPGHDVQVFRDYETTWIYRTEREEARVQKLRGLIADYNLDPWMFTRVILVAERALPHSHPILTLNTRDYASDQDMLKTLVHEQVHWYLARDVRHQTDAAMAALKEMYPEVPVGRENGGARDAYSTRLHLLVNMITFHIMAELIGDGPAMTQVANDRIYPWVSAQVQNPETHGPIMAMMTQHGIAIVPKIKESE